MTTPPNDFFETFGNCETSQSSGELDSGMEVVEETDLFQVLSLWDVSGSEPNELTSETLSMVGNSPSHRTEPDKRQRKRRPSPTRVVGNNRYGRKGKPRCEQCRAWRCIYNLNESSSSCVSCSTKNLSCGDKILSRDWKSKKKSINTMIATASASNRTIAILPIPAIFNGPADGQVTSFEGKHIQSLRQRHFLFKFKILQIGRTDGRQLWQNIFRRFGPNLNSKSARHGCTLYSLYLHRSKEDPIPYLSKFYQGTREAIKVKAADDIVYGCYAVCMYGLHTDLDFPQIMEHAKGFRVGMNSLVKEFFDEELFLLECMWEKLVWFMAINTVFRQISPRGYLEFLKNFSDPIIFPTWRMCPSWVKEALTILRVKIQFVRFVVALQLHGNPNFNALQELLQDRFINTWKSTSQSPLEDYAPRHLSRVGLRSLSANLWSQLLLILSKSLCTPEIPDLTAMSSVNDLVDQIPNPFEFDWVPLELWRLLDLAVCCLAFLGLTSAMFQLKKQFGSPVSQIIRLIYQKKSGPVLSDVLGFLSQLRNIYSYLRLSKVVLSWN